MKQCLQFVALIVMTILVYTAPGYADTVLLHNGDRLIGIVQDSSFALQGPYGQIIIRNGFLKRISLPENQDREAKLQTINNDLFNGTLLNDDIHILLQTKDTASADGERQQPRSERLLRRQRVRADQQQAALAFQLP